MEKTINVLKLLGSDIRSRSNAGAIEKAIDERGSSNCVIDMTGVVFISRSFADELLNVAKKTFSTIINAHGIAHTMIDIVSKSRDNKVSKYKGKEIIVKLQDMVSLENYFASF